MISKKTVKLITGNQAAAWGGRLILSVIGGCVFTFPITPQTEIIEYLEKWKADGEIPNIIVDQLESEHSVMSAWEGAASVGNIRVFTATSSQGLLLMNEVLYDASGKRIPGVLVNVSRGIAAPITLWTDHQDFLGVRDAGWIMFHAEDNQEVLDMIIMGQKISEIVSLPVLVNMDGFVLSFTKEPVVIPAQKMVNEFLGDYNPTHTIIPLERPTVVGAPVMGIGYTKFKAKHHLAFLNVVDVIERVQNEFAEKFGRKYDIVDQYMMEGAEVAIVVQGSMSTTAKAAVQEVRKAGVKAGLIRLRTIRPWPENALWWALKDVKSIGVIDRNLAPGKGGIMFPEIRDVMYDSLSRPVVSSFITGLGGQPQTVKSIKKIIYKTLETAETGKYVKEFSDLGGDV